MKAIDGLLNLVQRQGATELRLASNRAPRLFRSGEELPLTMPATTSAALETLLGDFLAEHDAAIRDTDHASFSHSSGEAGEFDGAIYRRRGAEGVEWEARFVQRRGAGRTAGADGERGRSAARSTGAEAERETSAAPRRAPDGAIAAVLQRAAAMKASDVHLTQDRAPIVRVGGELRALDGAGAVDLASLLDEEQLARVIAGRSVDLGLDVAGVGRLRVNVYHSEDGLSAAIRILSREAPALADLHLPPAVDSLVDLPHGLVIACGPTGSGKSTTLAALAQQAMRRRPHVLITLEDPIEYRIAPEGGLVRQREIGRHVADFATGLRDALREDPDVVLIGEMRDPESIGLALTAAETGHLVLTSLHSRTSASAVERIVDIYPPERQRQIRVQLADALRAVIAQRLLPRADGGGRVAAVELLRVTPGVANLIREGKTPQIITALQSGRDEGMVPLERTLAEMVRKGTVTLEAARAVADPKALDEYLRARGGS